MNLVNESFMPFLDDELLLEEFINEKFNLNLIKDTAKKAAIISSIFVTSIAISGEKRETVKHQLSNSSIITNLAKQADISKKDIERTFRKLISTNFIKNSAMNSHKLVQSN